MTVDERAGGRVDQVGHSLGDVVRLREAMRPRTDMYRLDERDLLFDCDLRSSAAFDIEPG